MNRPIAALLFVSPLFSLPASAQVFLFDGGSHVVDGPSPAVVVDYDNINDEVVPGAGTEVEFRAGADVGEGAFDDSVWSYGTSRVTINGGRFEQDVNASDDSRIEINGGQLEDDVYADGVAEITINDGTVFDDVEAWETGLITINGGDLQNDVIARESGEIIVNGGSIADDLEGREGGWVEIWGGAVGEDVEAFDFATVSIFGGLFTGLPGDLDTGFGAFGPGASLWIFGRDFVIDGVPVVPDPLAPLLLTGAGNFSGTLKDGNAFSMPYETGGGGAIFLLVPEPSMAWLQLGGLVVVLWMRRRRVRA